MSRLASICGGIALWGVLISASGGMAAAQTGLLSTGAAGSVQSAQDMKITSYDDGRSCPANCDSHVVFQSSHNGTANAFRPGPGADPFAIRGRPELQECIWGKACVICFSAANDSCLITTYRGSGPPRGRFDVTPAFLKKWCSKASLPATLSAKCISHMKAADRLAAKTNCIANPTDAKCRDIMAVAVTRKQDDAPRYSECKRMGETAYNQSLSDPSLRRTHDCAYFLNRKHAGGWFLLAPGACRDGYYVGRDSLDCCSADPVQAAIDPVECGPFYR